MNKSLKCNIEQRKEDMKDLYRIILFMYISETGKSKCSSTEYTPWWLKYEEKGGNSYTNQDNGNIQGEVWE